VLWLLTTGTSAPHIIGNYGWDSKPLLSLVLVGLPELGDGMTLCKNGSLWSRIHTRLKLGAAQPDHTAEYVVYRKPSANDVVVRAVGAVVSLGDGESVVEASLG